MILKHVDHLLEFFTVFVDKCHHGKEEELLFPALEQIGVERDKGPIGVMLKEHQQGREYVQKMKAAISQIKDGIGFGGCRFHTNRQRLHFAIGSTYRQREQRLVPHS